jgi:outer membrane cobalamin receptor
MLVRWIVCSWVLLLLLNTSIWSADPNTSDPFLPELTVTAPSDADYTTLPQRDLVMRPLTESPGLETATSVVGRKEIEEQHAFSVVDALKYTPGAWTETRGRKVKQFFSVRGQRYPYPGYLVDGAWFREFHEINYYLSAANFDRIEVMRSSSAMLHGPGGMTGMINLVPRTYEQQETQVEGLYGTHNTYRGYVTHGTTQDRLGYAVSAGTYHTDGSSNMNAQENMNNLYGRLQYRLSDDWSFSWTNIGLIGDRELKLALPPVSNALLTLRESFDPMHSYITVAKFRHQSSEDQATEILANYGGRRFDGFSSVRPGVMRLEEDYEYGTSVIHTRALTENNTLRMGALINRWVSPTGKRFYWGREADIRTYSGMIVDEHQFGQLNTSLGYRYTREHLQKFGGFSVEGSAAGLTTAQIDDEWGKPLHAVNFGSSYALTQDVSLFGNLSWAQLSAQPGMLDTNLNRPGNEDRYKADLGAKKQIHWAEIGVTAFYVYQDNAALASSAIVLDADGIDHVLFVAGDRRNYGTELDIKTNRFDNGLQGFFNVTVMQTLRNSGGAWQEDEEVPDVLVGGGASYLADPFEIACFVRHSSSYENNRFMSGGATAPLGDYTEVTGQVTYKHDPSTDLFVRVENMTNDEYSTVAGYPHDGMLFYAGAVKRFK